MSRSCLRSRAFRPVLAAGAVSLATVFGLFSIISGIQSVVLSTHMRKTHATAERLITSAIPEPTPTRR